MRTGIMQYGRENNASALRLGQDSHTFPLAEWRGWSHPLDVDQGSCRSTEHARYKIVLHTEGLPPLTWSKTQAQIWVTLTTNRFEDRHALLETAARESISCRPSHLPLPYNTKSSLIATKVLTIIHKTLKSQQSDLASDSSNSTNKKNRARIASEPSSGTSSIISTKYVTW